MTGDQKTEDLRMDNTSSYFSIKPLGLLRGFWVNLLIGLALFIPALLFLSQEHIESFVISAILAFFWAVLFLGRSIYWKRVPYVLVTNEYIEINDGILNRNRLEFTEIEYTNTATDRHITEISMKDGRVFSIRLKELSSEDRDKLMDQLGDIRHIQGLPSDN